jgi:copper chaperone
MPLVKGTKMNANTETLLDVAGMSCGSCVRHVSNALSSLAGIAAVDVRLKDGKVLVRHDPAQTSVEALVAALNKAGYGSSLSAAA